MSVLKKALAAMLAVLVIGGGAATAADEPTPASPTDAAEAEADELDAFVRDQMERTGVPGAAYAVVGPEGVRHTGAFGTDGDGEPVTTSTPFLWGSLAKPVAATLAVVLADDGTLDLDAPVVDLLPDFRTADRSASDRITVRQLLDQTSGIPDLPGSTDRYEPDRVPADVVADLVDADLASEPGTEHVYSSLNYAVLAAVIEEVTGQTYDEVLTERLLAPIGADSALTSQADESALPPGHRYVAGRTTPFTTHIDPAGAAYGYLGGDVQDLAAFAQASLEGGPLLTDAQRQELTAPAVETGDDSAYGLGWRTWRVPGTDDPMIWHSGAVPGYQSSIVLLPDRDEAIVVVQNAYGSFQEAPLLDTAWGLASLRSGVEPELNGVDPTYWGLLAAAAATTAGLALAAVRSGWRLARPRAGRGLLGLVAWLLPLGVVGAVAWWLQSFFGITRDQLPLWAPDVAWGLDAVLLLTVVLAVLRIAVTARSLSATRRSSSSAGKHDAQEPKDARSPTSVG